MNWIKNLFFGIFLFYATIASGQNMVFDSKLPFVYVNTNELEIQDEPKITAEIGIVWNTNGELNNSLDTFNHFNGKIGIEIRGSSSQKYPKKSFGFELRDEQGEGVDFPLLGMPEEEDWILYAPYSDKSLIRNVLTFSLAENMGAYVPRCRFVELFINNNYEGVYVLMEKIKRDKNRVAISKLKEDESSGEDLTGGYIVQIDRASEVAGDGWSSGYRNIRGINTYYKHVYPKPEDIIQEQKDYIKSYVDEFETAVYDKNFDPENGYSSFIDLQSFADFIVINELTKNIDAYRASTFLFKDKSGKLNAGPIWDFNLGYGNADFYDGWETEGLQIEAELDAAFWQNPFWWNGMMSDPYFSNSLRCRWDELRESSFSNEQIVSRIDSLVGLLQAPSIRNFDRWPVIGEYVWPNYFIGTSYEEEIDWLKAWIENRVSWLDINLPGECDELTAIDHRLVKTSAKVYPNPFSENLVLQIQSKSNVNCSLQLFHVDGSLILEKSYMTTPGLNSFDVPVDDLLQGIYVCRIFSGNTEVFIRKIVKN